MKKYFFLLVVIFVVLGCHHKSNCSSSAKFKINNRSASSVAVEISPSEQVKLRINDALPHAVIDTSVCFDRVPHIDGNFSIHVKHTGLDTIVYTGYYTNGIAPGGYMEVNISDHLVKVIEVP